MSEFDALDPERIRRLFDLRSEVYNSRGGAFEVDPYPEFHHLRESGPIHEGTVHELVGCEGDHFFQGLPYPDRPHYSAFDFETCEAAFRDGDTFASSPHDEPPQVAASILFMNGSEHRRYRSLVQPSFVPNRARWWIEHWIDATVHALIDRMEPDGRADLNTDLCAPIPLLTITGSFGVPIADALDIRAAVTADGQAGALAIMYDHLGPIIAARREEPTDDLISVLVHAELADEDGVVHRLTDDEVFAFSFLLLAAGSGTTWKQMGITLLALLRDPPLLERVREDRTLIRAVVEESLRWTPTDPMFARFVTTDVDFYGTKIPAGAVMHLCLAAGNRDPSRWDDPDRFDPFRPLNSHLGFGNGPHICLGMHVARAEIATAVGAALDRLPNLRLDPDGEEPRIIGMYERGPTVVPVLWG
jgi:cytochrome P450